MGGGERGVWVQGFGETGEDREGDVVAGGGERLEEVEMRLDVAWEVVCGGDGGLELGASELVGLATWWFNICGVRTRKASKPSFVLARTPDWVPLGLYP